MAKAKAITTHETVAELGEVIRECVDFTGCTVHKPKTPGDRSEIEHKTRLLNSLQDHCEEQIFWTLARTPADAIIQIARVSAEVESFELDEETEARERKWQALLRDVDRALYSVIRWIEREHKVQRPAVTDWYMGDHMDPWNTLAAYMKDSATRVK